MTMPMLLILDDVEGIDEAARKAVEGQNEVERRALRLAVEKWAETVPEVPVQASSWDGL
jgi:hypothetical protein